MSLAACAFFAGLEMAFISSNKLKIELGNKQGSINSKIISYFTKRPSHFIAAMLVGNCIGLVVCTIFMEHRIHPFIGRFIHVEWANLLITTLISTCIILLAAEFIPKSLFRINPNLALNLFAIPLFLAYWILSPLVYLTMGISGFFLKVVFRVELREDLPTFGRVDLDNLVRESTSRAAEKHELDHEVQIFRNALDFSDVRVRECMVPRTEIVALSVDTPIELLRKRFVETRLSKMLIYEGNIDNLMGYTHSFELFRNPTSIRNILLPVLIIPESMPAKEALTLFIQQHKSVAVVVDEFGVTAGILTMEDVMEEIFGEIEDEHDKEELVSKKISETEFILSGRMEIDLVNSKFGLNIPIGEGYETISGFILHHFQSIPGKGEVIRVGEYVFTILSQTDNRIDMVRLNLE
jgi:putative hemolysin